MKMPYVIDDQVGFLAPQSKQHLLAGNDLNRLRMASTSDLLGSWEDDMSMYALMMLTYDFSLKLTCFKLDLSQTNVSNQQRL